MCATLAKPQGPAQPICALISRVLKFALYLLGSLTIFAQNETAPPLHHIWSMSGALTPPSSAAPVSIAQNYIQSIAAQHGVNEKDLAGLYLVKEHRSTQISVTHLLFRQQGQVLNAGGKLFPRPSAAAPSIESGAKAIRAAAREVNPAADSSYLPSRTFLAKGEKTLKFVRGGFGAAVDGQPVWYPVGRELRAAWTFYMPDSGGFMYYRTVVDAQTQAVLKNTRLGAYQNPQPPRGLVFSDSPQPNPNPGTLTGVRPYVERVMVSFAGDLQASPKGWVDGTETAGNNTVTGQNTVGLLTSSPTTAKSANRDFSFPLQLGPGAPTPTAFRDAATTNLFYWMNRIHDFYWRIGFDEAAGNFQQDNLGRGGIGGDPMYA